MEFERKHKKADRLLGQVLLGVVGLALCSCEGFKVPALEKLKEATPSSSGSSSGGSGGFRAGDSDEAEAMLVSHTINPAGNDASVNMNFLLSMNYEEAKSISPQSAEVSPNFKVAAESVEILKVDTATGKPKKVRAKGKVYLESGSGEDVIRVLCQEAYISYGEAVLRGKPILQRGASTIEGLDESTVFYTLGQRISVIGKHRLTNPDTMVAQTPDLGPWSEGPNPLLPALSEGSVPANVRSEMLKAAEAEMILQQNRQEAHQAPEAPLAPWVKEDKKKGTTKPVPKVEDSPPSKSRTSASVETPAEEKGKIAVEKAGWLGRRKT